jgi:hypothetical protein
MKHVGNVSCGFSFGADVEAVSTGVIRLHKTRGRVGAFVIACPVPDGSRTAADLPDQWKVTVSMAGASIPVEVCYDHVEKPVDVVLCTEPAFGYSRKAHFWRGDPPYASQHTMVDAFLTYHTELMQAHVRFNDLDDDSLEAVLPYTWNGQVSCRPGWRLSPLNGSDEAWIARVGYSKVHGHALAFEVLAYAACHWEFRYRAHWAMMISSVDNFVAPLEDISLVTALKRSGTQNVSAMHVPTVEGFSSGDSPTSGANILLRYPVAGQDLSFANAKHTPIINPRHLETVWVHWATEFRPVSGLNRISWEYEETLRKLRVRTLHMMALTRVGRNVHGGSADTLFLKRGAQLQDLINKRLGGYL